MQPKQSRALRIGLEWSAVMGAVIALIAGDGTLAKASIVALATFGAAAVSIAVAEHGWLKAPVPVGTPLRAFIILSSIWGAMLLVVLWVWPPQPKTVLPAPPLAVKRPHLHVDSVEFLKVSPGKPMGVNLFYRNDGDADMADQHIYALIARTAPASAPADSKVVEDYLWDQFTKSPRQQPTSTHVVPAHSMGVWTTVYGEPLDAWQTKRLKDGGFTIWFMGSAVYKDSVGEQTTNFCVYYNGNPKVIFICGAHNGDAMPQR